ncbi:hypothetical protein [Halorubrum sp. F4]|uniref:hypothetical protein n=1 Tax=Halorubrum sp. F4 TaxID=2989715 RepID=UPI002481692C|nr:hypothetical protein [Halorubrum sp. F4]
MSDDPTDRSGDPTDRSDDEVDVLDDDSIEETDVLDDEPFDGIDADRGEGLFTGPDGTGETERTAADPFAELEDDPEPVGAGDDPFERMEVDEVDVDGVWDALEAGPDDLDEGVEVPEADPREATDHVVDKRTYCHRCPYFAEPPETACTHEDASILEAIGFEEFRLRDCPMVTDEGPRFDRHGRIDE